MKPILVVNSGSSSLKYQVLDADTGQSLLAGLLERVTDHQEAFATMLQELDSTQFEIKAVGHRVVHGGAKFSKPSLITTEIVSEIEQLVPLAPLHNPGNLSGIKAALKAFPGLPQVAVFDTAFHQTMPASSYSYAIDAKLAAEHGVRKYGFHGSSYAYVAKQTAAFIGKDPEELNAVILHLGNGASACAVRGGSSFDTSMGISPLPGLVMGTRSGDIDPAIIFYLHNVAGLGFEDIDLLLNKSSGLLGLTGSADLRDVLAKADAGDVASKTAIEVYVQRIKHYLGAYIAQLGSIDALVFTAGVGENSDIIRELVCQGLQGLGIELDQELNSQRIPGNREISKSTSRAKVLVIPTNEELEIAKQTALFLA